jgi:hypothetical protein
MTVKDFIKWIKLHDLQNDSIIRFYDDKEIEPETMIYGCGTLTVLFGKKVKE